VLAARLRRRTNRADRKRIDGVEAPICSLVDLVAMKRATRPRQRRA